MSEPQVTVYQCTNPNCTDGGERTKDRDSGNNPPAPADLICWKCRSQMTMLKIGGEK